MKNSRLGMGIVVVFGVSGWLFAAREPLIPVFKSFFPSGSSFERTAPATDKPILPPEVDFRDPKVRAAQEAAYSKKYHPLSQGIVMEYPEKAIKVVEEPKKETRPQEATSPQAQPGNTEPEKKMTRVEWSQTMDKYYRAMAKGEVSPDAEGQEEVSEEKADGWLSDIKDARSDDSSWQKVGSD